jgi:hypothetical protein
MSKNFLPYLLQRSYASSALDIIKMRDFTPCEVEDQFNTYRTTIVEVVFDPLHISEVNNRFEKAGYDIEESMSVITSKPRRLDSTLGWIELGLPPAQG